MEKIVRKEEGDHSGLIYGQGHAIYTLSDPRAVILKTHAQRLAKEKGMDDEFALYQLVEKLAPKAFLNVKGDKKVISANVDFYSGLVYKMLGLPEDLYTPMFAVSRIAGWKWKPATGLSVRRISLWWTAKNTYHWMKESKISFLPLKKREK